MRTGRIVMVAALFLLVGCKKPANEEIRKAFESYQSGLLTGDGAKAVAAVDAETIAYYQKMKEMALSAPAAAVKKESLMDRLMIASLRHRLERVELARMSPAELFRYGVEKGWIGKDSVTGVTLGEIAVDGERATAVMVKGGTPTPVKFAFKRESDGWRLNLPSIFGVANDALAQVAKQQATTEDDFIVQVLEGVTGEKVRANIWEPEPTPEN